MKAPEKVIIVGGGPVGLLCALNLAVHYVPVLVLEAHSELFMDLRAGSFHPPTLEVMQPLGLTAKLMEIGIPVRKWQLPDREKGVVGTFQLSLLSDETAFPFRLHLEQHRFTPIVLDEVRKLPNVAVRLSCRVENVTQEEAGVRVMAQTPDGQEQFDASWVIGAHGGGSSVRTSANIAFDGFTFPERFALVSTTQISVSMASPTPPIFRTQSNGARSSACPIRDHRDYGAFCTDAIRTRASRRRCPTPPSRNGCNWSSQRARHRATYRVHQRVATTFRNGRMLIAGDAAHLNNPIGGFGLNCGLQDAMTLTDKLSRVMHGDASDDLLHGSHCAISLPMPRPNPARCALARFLAPPRRSLRPASRARPASRW